MSEVADFLIPVKLKTEEQTAAVSQSVFTLSSITVPNADTDRLIVAITGVKQPKSSYTVDSTSQVTMDDALEGGELVEFTVPSYKT